MTSTTLAPSRALQLKASTADVHDNIDKSIMDKDPFANTENYIQFLTLQYYFLNDVSTLYDHSELNMVIENLAARRRLNMLEQDFQDLEYPVPASAFTSLISNETDLATALGWLYVVEGSKVGAAMLGKQAQARLLLTKKYGARYLSGPGAGRGSDWRHLVQLIDSIELNDTQERALINGARQAFTRFQLFQAHVYS
ncbi:biliverdin-producing heme oxygenase [Pseudoalteromonas sp. S1608]|uniref:biliverdin-producing heme oxygenase n=1 Tax=Pseudoalteromonas sp. S1608 TaxID=579504 RepID=UPI00110B2A48|nr:biliverdin-producing heme oxygenase [Pseudoalteromonas sp. S1608]TMP73966.1 heme oxygenase [Pseudoalteromonas sp. S1608]